MTERPILFSGPMVRAILSGAKTVTRRPISPQPAFEQIYEWRGKTLYEGSGRRWFFRQHYLGDVCCNQPEFSEALAPFCPLGAPGDRLWVRETWCPGDYWTSGVVHDPPEDIRYAADNSAISYATGAPLRIDTSGWSDPKRWRPSIHMPRWASRLSLDVVNVGVERLQDISEDDARREGVGPLWLQDGEQGCWYTGDPSKGAKMHARTARDAFERLWTEVYGPGVWTANPWVWRVEFTRVEGGR